MADQVLKSNFVLMSEVKNQTRFARFLTVILLILFVLSASLSLIHSFLHQNFEWPPQSLSFKISSDSQSNNSKNADNVKKPDAVLVRSLWQKIIFAHHASDNKKTSGCVLCSFHISQSQILALQNLTFDNALFCLFFAIRKFSRVKLSYLLTSRFSRAPPAFS
jgi:hypothetical protein